MVPGTMRGQRSSGSPLRLLYVTNGVPYVPSTGGPTRAYHLLRAAAGLGPVTLLGVGKDEAEPRHASGRALCETVELVPAHHLPYRYQALPQPFRPAARRLDHLIAARPAVQWRFDAEPLRTAVRRRLASNRYDLVIAEHTEIGWALRDILQAWGGPTLADLHNVLSVHESRVGVSTARGIGATVQQWRRIRRLQRIESAILTSYTRTTAVSDVDAGYLKQLTVSGLIEVVPNGVDLAYFGRLAECPEPAAPVDTVVFTGALWYRPNVEGLQFFVREIWPRIQRRRPRARFLVVGARPDAAVLRLGTFPGVEIVGPVPDVRPFLAAATLAVVPLRLGTGTRLKILEALAARVPVVSTSLGAEGLELQPNRDIIVRDPPQEFADAVVHVLETPGEARRLAEHGHAAVRQHYDWDVIGMRFSDTLRHTVNESHGMR